MLMSHCVLFCVLYRKESANKRYWYCNTVNNLISLHTIRQNDEKPHTAEPDDTAKLKLSKYRMKKAQYRNTVNPHVPLYEVLYKY